MRLFNPKKVYEQPVSNLNISTYDYSSTTVDKLPQVQLDIKYYY